ncbi:membrane protein [Microbacterium sp. SLBN-154]|uniref:YihY/virulence factor BrkB family protein n=1 Tax=Microbacterium sp. SLBN-154 TaxID=2768458 RepID=UPI001175C1BE|nr:YihY/virulence factor BrkB family protein [Microbacterium sp. SLBN-154]TQK18948.1 membrane protein [Microbacterium sp. SLBN-154]
MTRGADDAERADPDAESSLTLTAAQRWSDTEGRLRERFDVPLTRATELTRRTLAWFPVRVWRHFLQHNGFLLAAGVSYQSLFAIFGVIYLAFAIVGLWLGASSAAIQRAIEIINEYIPNLISENGLVTPEQVEDVANQSASALGITGAIALVVVIWTAIGFITFTRRAVRDIFGLPFDRRPYVLLKARDFVAAVIFGVALLAGASLSSFAVWALEGVFDLLGLAALSMVTDLLTRLLSLSVSFAINAAALAALIRFLTGAALGWRRIWPGAMLGGAAIVVLQIGAGLLLRYTPSNPLLTTFTVFIGFLLWFRLNSIVILVAGAWIAVAAADRNVALAELSEEERRLHEHEALVVAARVRVRDAQEDLATAPWFRRWNAARTLRRAEEDLAALEASPPPPVRRSLLLE